MWRSLHLKSWASTLIAWAFFLIALGTAVFVAGSVFGLGWGQAFGGAVFGTGLTILSSTIISRVSVREQYAKEANLKRKDDYYGPLHANLKALREQLEAARNGENAYPLWIAGTGQQEPTGRRMVGDALTLTKWSEFKTDYRIDNFTPDACNMLDSVLDRANRFNVAIDAARAPTRDALEPALAKAAQSVAQRADFRDWQQRRAEQMKASRRDPDDEANWFQRLVEQLPPNLNPPVAQQWASGWVDGWGLYRPETLGWLLARRPDRAALCLDGSVYTQGSHPAAPPTDWRQAVFESAMQTLDGDQLYEQARHAAQGLLDAVAIAEKQLAEALLYIREHYEGGRPLV